MSAAVARGTHRLWDAPPWIVDDPFALVLVGPTWPEFASGIRSLMPLAVFRRGHAFVQIRSRYCEDRLLARGCAQYVILGAGLDSFVWRRPDLLRTIRVFEVDHPATQIWKQKRAAALGLPTSSAHVYVPLDFDREDLGSALANAGFDVSIPVAFTCVGTTMYLAPETVAATLRFVARCARGSEIAMSYNVTRAFMDSSGLAFLAAVTPNLANQGEPVMNGFAPTDMEALISAAGLAVVDHPTSDDLHSRYCAGRSDDLRPYTLERLVAARRVSAQ
jgi:methyltransferase (TIGR00027 family)